ncbi:MAG: PAS domain S-box protein, partial [Phycisphaerae bacterium]|nr:PAS domain S-box protein [Phycisphaerae bacterium]
MNRGKDSLFSTNKAKIEFAAAIVLAVILFEFINHLGFFEGFYRSSSTGHLQYDKLLLAIAFLAAVMMIFCFRRWFELRKAHKELTKSEEQLRFQAMLLDEIGDGVTATDLEGKIIYVNQTECNWIKSNKDELRGKSVKIFGDDSSLGATQQEIIQTTLEKGKWSGEIVNTAQDGSTFIVECRTWLIKDKNDRPVSMCGVARDITERKQREQELARHKQYLEALDKAAGILLLSISEIKYEEFLNALGPASGADRVHIFLKVTDDNLDMSFKRKMQWRRNEKFLPVPTELVEKRFFGEIFPGWYKTLTNGGYISFGAKNFPPEQFDHWNSLQIKALLVVPVLIDDQLKGFISFDNCTDSRPWTESEIEFLETAAKDLAITLKRFDYKKELKQERDFAKRLIETAQTIVLVLDNDANIVTFNPYFEKLSGYKLEEVKGKNWFNVFLPFEYRQKVTRVFQEAVHNIHIDANINPIVTKNSRLRHIEWYGRTLRDYNGKVIGLLSTGQDITERLKADERLKKAHSELEQRVAQRTAELQNINTKLMR